MNNNYYQNGTAKFAVIRFPCSAPSCYHFGCHGEKEFWELKLEVGYSARDVFGGHVPSHGAFISLFVVFLKLR